MPSIAKNMTIYDVIIVGAGPAGLSAALVLGRCRERVLVLDDERPRNRASHASHGFFSRDGESPERLRRLGLEQLRHYDVTVEACHVTSIERHTDGLFAALSEARLWFGRKILLATGIHESDSDIPGVTANLGKGVFSCPYCDGYEVRDGALGALVTTPDSAEYAITLLTWSANITLFTHSQGAISDNHRARFERHGVKLVEERIECVQPGGERRIAVHMVDGRKFPLDGLFVHAGQHQPSPLALAAGCELDPSSGVCTNPDLTTKVPGLFVAGDANAQGESIAGAVADGYRSGIAIHRELHRERFP